MVDGMNSDIRLSVSFWDHWKTVVLKEDLGYQGVESLQRLWCFSETILKPHSQNFKTLSIVQCELEGNHER